MEQTADTVRRMAQAEKNTGCFERIRQVRDMLEPRELNCRELDAGDRGERTPPLLELETDHGAGLYTAGGIPALWPLLTANKQHGCADEISQRDANFHLRATAVG